MVLILFIFRTSKGSQLLANIRDGHKGEFLYSYHCHNDIVIAESFNNISLFCAQLETSKEKLETSMESQINTRRKQLIEYYNGTL